jgi:hypothetical protein
MIFRGGFVRRLGMVLAVAVAAWSAEVACSSGAKSKAAAPPPTPTPGLHERVNPNVIEETDTYFIERLPKKDYIRVDENHIKHPLLPAPVEFFKEDADYYYVYNPKMIPEEVSAEKQKQAAELPPVPRTPPGRRHRPSPPESDFTSITPERTATAFRLEEVAGTGLPDGGLWRASFVLADMNGDGILDIVSPAPRLGGDGRLRIFLGDGKGHFSRWPLTFIQDGKATSYSVGYGGVAVADLDGDGKLDVVAASHGGGLTALFGDGKGTFTVSRAGLKGYDFSTQAVILADVNGDGRPDIIAARDTYEAGATGWNRDQAQVFMNKGGRAFELRKDALFDASHSTSATAWDFDGDGRPDALLGSNAFAAVLLLFHNDGNGKLSSVVVPDVEVWAYHPALAPGTFGRERAPAFADVFYKGNPELVDGKAAGINIHVLRAGQWEKHRVWRERMGKAVLYAVAFGDLDGDGLDDVIFPDSDRKRLRIFLQQADGSFKEAAEEDEPRIGLVPQCVRLADLDGDGRLDVVLSKTAVAEKQGGWTVFLNKRK